jgi:hypothetical protein
MGYDLLFYKLKDGKMVWDDEEGVPEAFSLRFADRSRWHFAMLDVPHDYKETCGCVSKHSYGCADPAAWRPTDFAAFREKLKAEGLWHKPFRCMTRWLERHPEVYVSFSN